MTKEDILTRVLESLEQIKRTNQKSRDRELQNNSAQRNYYSIDISQCRINLCEELIKFITDNLEKGNK